jgi:glucoamylase
VPRPGKQPAGAPDATGRRIAHLPAAVLGNGSLLATVSARGEIEQLWWPRVDVGPHLAELRLALHDGEALHWLDEEPLSWEQRYLEDATVLVTEAGGAEITDLVRPSEPVLVRRVRARGRRLVVYVRPQLDDARHGQGCYADLERGALVFHRHDTVLALGLDLPHELTCGRSHRGDHYSVLRDLDDGRLEGMSVAHRSVEGALAWDGEEATLAFAFGHSPEEALSRLDSALAAGADALVEERRQHDRERVESARAASSEELEPLYRRSLLVFDLVTDRETGGVIAAPELDPAYSHSGGYGFVWPRDLAFTALAFLACGRDDLARAGLRWLARTQEPEGLWLHRHWTNGALAPTWGLHQIDETGSALFAFDAVYGELGDDELDRELWPVARRGAEFLLAFLDHETGLPRPSVDLWEQHEGQHAFSAAAVFGGLSAAAALAERHEPGLADAFTAGASRVQEGIERHLWSAEHGRYLRGVNVGRRDERGAPVPACYLNDLRFSNRPVGSVDRVDPRIDASLLGLAWPFRAVDPASPRMQATVQALVSEIGTPAGGLRRHAGDDYAGGNEWVLTGLWHGLWSRQVGDDAGLDAALRRAMESATPLGLLPEQVLEDGRPGWVLPLTWSHAMYVLAARPELAALAGPPLASGRAASPSS